VGGVQVLYLTEESITFSGSLVRGGAILVRNVVEGLRERGHDVHLIDWGGGVERPYQHTVDPGVRFVLGPTRTYRRAVDVGRREDVDVVVSKTRKTYLPGLLAARRLGVPHVVHVGSLPEPTGSGALARLDAASFAGRLGLPHDGYLVVCEAIAAALERRGVPRDRVYDVKNAVDAERFRPDGDADLDAVGVDLPDPPLVGYVGGLHDYKGVLDLADAVDRTTESFALAVAGDGPERETLADRLDAPHAVLGPVPYEQMPALYRALDVLVLPSHTEGLPRVVLEAGASGAAVLASDVGGVGEVVEDGETGVLVPPRRPDALAAALDDLVADPDRRERYATTARERMADHYSWACLYDRHERAFDAVVDAAE